MVFDLQVRQVVAYQNKVIVPHRTRWGIPFAGTTHCTLFGSMRSSIRWNNSLHLIRLDEKFHSQERLITIVMNQACHE
jgi:hypothetical protein